MLAAAVAFSVACCCGSGLLALRWTLAHREKRLEHAPLAEMQRKLEALESQLLAGAMQRR